MKQIPNEGLVVVKFSAPWCQPCKTLSPVVDALQQELGFTLINVNVDEDMDAAEAYNVRALPTMLVYKNGKQVETIVGGRPKDFLQAAFEAHK